VTTVLTPAPDDIVGIVVYMEARLAQPFQAAVPGVLTSLEQGPDPAELYEPVAGSGAGPRDAWAMPAWDPTTDRPAAAWIVESLASHQLRVLAGLLAASPHPGATTGELLAGAAYPDGTRAGPVFRAIGGRFRRVQRRPIWNGGGHTETGQRLPVPTGAARTLFIEAIRDRWPGLAAEFELD
jgi:hypothetical protein